MYDTCSDTDLEDVDNVLSDSQREIYSVETKKSNWEEDGFVKEKFYNEYVRQNNVNGHIINNFCLQTELMGICSDNLQIIIEFLKNKDLNETFISKK